MSYLLDSNTLIYASQPDARFVGCRHWLQRDTIAVSAISLVEVLGFHSLTQIDAAFFATVFRFVPQLPINEAILAQAILVRQLFRLKTPDAVVAATALVHGLALVTADSDFTRVAGLVVVNPLPSA